MPCFPSSFLHSHISSTHPTCPNPSITLPFLVPSIPFRFLAFLHFHLISFPLPWKRPLSSLAQLQGDWGSAVCSLGEARGDAPESNEFCDCESRWGLELMIAPTAPSLYGYATAHTPSKCSWKYINILWYNIRSDISGCSYNITVARKRERVFCLWNRANFVAENHTSYKPAL